MEEKTLGSRALNWLRKESCFDCDWSMSKNNTGTEIQKKGHEAGTRRAQDNSWKGRGTFDMSINRNQV